MNTMNLDILILSQTVFHQLASGEVCDFGCSQIKDLTEGLKKDQMGL